MNFSNSVLSSLLWCPIVGALIVSLLPRRVAREGAFVVAFINFIFSLHLLAHWNDASGVVTDGKFRFVENTLWLPQLGVNYHLGVDGISLWMVLLTTFLVPLVMLFSWNLAQRTKEFMVCLLLMQAAIIGVFCALDVILFYIFWEAVLIPTLLLIGTWGGSKRAAASVKFFVYTMAGSVLMWVAMLWLYFQQPTSTRSFDYNAMLQAANNSESSMVAFALFGAFAIAFAIKAPLFPFHTWLPDTYAEAPTAASVLLAAVLSKMGIYGFLRFAIPFFPATAREFAPILAFLAIAGIIYGAFVAISQTDVKKVIAYSSVSHLGLILLGVFAALSAGATYGEQAMSGAVLQMVAHGLSTGALFLLAGAMLERVPNREMGAFGGVAAVMPRFTVFFWLAMFASIGLPGLSNFVGEYLIFQGVMAANFWWAVLATSTVILSAIYMLRMFRNTMYGEVSHSENNALPDLGKREVLVLAILALAIIYVGVKPQPLLNTIAPDAREIIVPRPENENQVAQLSTSSTR